MEPSYEDWGMEQSRVALLFIFYFILCIYIQTQGGLPILGEYIYLLQSNCDVPPVKRSKVKFGTL